MGIERGQGAEEDQHKREHEPFQKMPDDVFPGELYFSSWEKFGADDDGRDQGHPRHLKYR